MTVNKRKRWSLTAARRETGGGGRGKNNFLTCLLLAGLAWWCPPAQAASKRPNILFICTDQQRNDIMSCSGNPYLKTPAMDSLAARGVRYTQSFCAFPVCSPSRANHFTSRMGYEIGITGNSQRLPEGLPGMGSLFQAAGYHTVWTGKWHLPSSFPTQQGEIPGFEILAEEHSSQGAKRAKGGNKGEALKDLDEAGAGGTQRDPGATAAAIRFLKQKHDQPFLLVVSLLNPHDICYFTDTTPQKVKLPADPAKLPSAPANANAPDHSPESFGKGAVQRNSGVTWGAITLQQQLYYYHRLTERVDALIGQVLAALREAGLEENTLVLFTSDHGEMAGAHQRIRKMALYEEAISVPFIVAGPGVPRGRVDATHLVSGLDVLPTLCDFAGIPGPPQARGLSVRKIQDDSSAPWREVVFAQLGPTGGRMARTARYKYNLYEGNVPELFDLQADPGETKNLAADPAQAATLAAHRQLLQDWMAKTSDPFASLSSSVNAKSKRKKGR